MIAGLVIVPLVSLISPKMDQKEVDSVFECYNEKHMVELRYALPEEEQQ
jgi:SSS family solute:Na+ symporter